MTDELKVIRQQPNQELIEILERLLEDAKTGEMQGFAFAKVFDDEQTTHGWSLNRTYMAPGVIGELFKAMTKLSNKMDGIDSSIIKYP